MEPFRDELLYAYPLTPQSVVMDIGAYEGNWTNIIHERYGCTVHAYEPVPAFFNKLAGRFAANPKIRLWPFGLGRENATYRFGVKGELSGPFCTSPNSFEMIPVRDFVEVVDTLSTPPSLVTINAEGSEYDILEYALDTGLAKTLPFIQVQSHTVVPNYQERWDQIVRRLTETHEHVFSAPWCWDGFALRKGGAL